MSEPVVWVWDHQLEELNDLGSHKSIRAWASTASHRSEGLTPLYTHPPIERTLNDEKIAELWHQNGGFHHHFARAVERWLKGKE